MLSEKMVTLLNRHITVEREASSLYSQISCWFAVKRLYGFSEYFKKESKNETEHANKMIDYILRSQGSVKLLPLEEPQSDFSKCDEVLEAAVLTERDVTAKINALMEAAIEDGDFATQSFLNWFVDNQVNEELEAVTILEKLKLIGDSGVGLLILDDEMGE